jgi:hypothetical protein
MEDRLDDTGVCDGNLPSARGGAERQPLQTTYQSLQDLLVLLNSCSSIPHEGHIEVVQTNVHPALP